MLTELIGYIAGAFIMLSFVPQVWKSYKTKKVDDVSIWLIIASVIGAVFWEIYAFRINSSPLLIMNGAFGIIVIIQLILQIKYQKK